MALVLLLGVGLVARWGQAALASSRAQAAADAAALAWLAAGDAAASAHEVIADAEVARSIAHQAGGGLVDFDVRVSDHVVQVEVVVEVDGQRAAAAAQAVRSDETPTNPSAESQSG